MVAENVLLGSGKVLTTGGLKVFNVLLGHVDEQREIGSVTPETHLGKLVEEELASLELLVFGSALLVSKRLGKTS